MGKDVHLSTTRRVFALFLSMEHNDTAKGERLRYTFKLAQTVCRVAF